MFKKNLKIIHSNKPDENTISSKIKHLDVVFWV
jgi:hypothetical protein